MTFDKTSPTTTPKTTAMGSDDVELESDVVVVFCARDCVVVVVVDARVCVGIVDVFIHLVI